jgi:hypothetical protein
MKEAIRQLIQKREDALRRRAKAETRSDSLYLNGYLSAINDALRALDPRVEIK